MTKKEARRRGSRYNKHEIDELMDDKPKKDLEAAETPSQPAPSKLPPPTRGRFQLMLEL